MSNARALADFPSGSVADLVYPVGSLYFSTQNTDPGTIFGGTWAQVAQGRTIIGEGSGAGLTARTAGAEGGFEDSVLITHSHNANTNNAGSHSHNTNNTGSHTHLVNFRYGNFTGAGDEPQGSAGGSNATDPTQSAGSHSHNTNNAGSHSHNISVADAGSSDGVGRNMPPFLVTYIWERTG